MARLLTALRTALVRPSAAADRPPPATPGHPFTARSDQHMAERQRWVQEYCRNLRRREAWRQRAAIQA